MSRQGMWLPSALLLPPRCPRLILFGEQGLGTNPNRHAALRLDVASLHKTD